ncbi:MAG: TonB-dependent receptor [bacterium]|nr:TonB-dependent receptor [bacterium]
MKRERLWVLAAVVCTAFAVSIPLWSGTTGRIAGQVTDRATGQPYYGANVILVGTALGAATDANGEFSILQVPPGVYSVQVRAMGFKSVTVTDVQVRIDQTSPVDFKLDQELIPGETVTISGKREAVKQDVATSVSAFSSAEIKDLAVTTVNDLVQLQAGVDKGLAIRGGDESELLFQINGTTLRDPRNNKPITGVALNAVQEVAMERGGFNAEYGQVRSGIINVVTREGGKQRYSGGLTVKGSPPAPKQFGKSVFDKNSMWMRPYLDDAVCWTGTASGAWDPYTQRQYPDFRGWNAVSDELLADADPTNDLTPAAARRLFTWEHRKTDVNDQFDYNIDAGFGGPVPFIGKSLGDLRFFGSFKRDREMLLIPLTRDDYVVDNWMFQLTSDIKKNMKLTASEYGGWFTAAVANFMPDGQGPGYLNNQFGPNDSRVARYWMPTMYLTDPLSIAQVSNEQRAGRLFGDSWYSEAFVRHAGGSLKLTHTLSAKTFYEGRLEYVKTKYTTGPVRERNYARTQEIVPGYFADEAPFGWSANSIGGVGGAINIFGGHSGQSRDTSDISAITLKFDMTSQLNFYNLFKTGLEFVYNDLDLYYGSINNFTGLRIMNKSHKFPFRGALYAQNKLEAKGFVVNAGLRLDYSNANTDWIKPVNPFDVTFYASNYLYNQDAEFRTEKAKADISLSPRLGISHPITESSKLYFNYGHFKQLPTYEELIRTGRGAGGEMQNYGDPNLELAKTVSYELGYDQEMFGQGGLLIQAAAFYHDISNQQSFTTYTSADGKVSYSAANSNNYADVRGFEVTLKRNTGWVSGFANYTYQVSSYGYFGNPFVFQSVSRQRDSDARTRTTFLYQQKPIAQPYARTSLVLNSPKGFGPELMNVRPLENWTMNLLFNWKAGEYITYNPDSKADVVSNVQVTDFTNFSLRVNKLIPLAGFNWTFFVEVDNLFNTKKLSGAGFYDTNDYLFYMQSLHLPKSDDYDNIPGDDRVGEYRRTGVAFQPMTMVAMVSDISNPDAGMIYYETSSKKYMQSGADGWQQVPKSKIDRILKDKAYIDMPNQTYFNFLNPRQIFFGVNVSF